MVKTVTVTLGAICLAVALSACGGIPAAVIGGMGSAGSAYLAIDKITEKTAPYIEKGCAEYEKAKAAAEAVAGLLPASAVAKIAAIKSFGDAACANPPSGDPLSTAIWLGHLGGQINTAVADR